jgi:phosphatidylglycerol:prolipoprotein diacylglycerol transferase
MGNVISFPGLGIGEFTVNPVAFSIFGYDIMWYGIIITLAMVTGFFVALRNSKIENIKTDDVLDLAIFLIIFSMVGARLYYVLMKLKDYKTFWDIINVRNGGLAIYGGVGAGALTVLVVSKVKKIATAKMYDMVAPGLIIGQVIGRWGNFMNAEAHGVETKLPWRMGIMYAGSSVTKYYHPTFLYESLWNLIGFALLMLIYRKKRYDGQIAFMYITWYGFGRFFIEGLRTDSLYLGPIRISQLVGAVCFVIGIIMMIIFSRKAHELELEKAEYSRVFSKNEDSKASENKFGDENYSINTKTTEPDLSENKHPLKETNTDGKDN